MSILADGSYAREIANLANAAAKERPAFLPTLNPLVRFHRDDAKGTYERVAMEWPPFLSYAESIESLVRIVVDQSQKLGQDGAPKPGDASIFYRMTGIAGFPMLLRQSRVEMKFNAHPGWLILKEWGKNRTKLRQDELYHLLRLQFRGAAEAKLIEAIGRVTWNLGDNGEKEVRNTGISMSRSVVQKLSGVSELPDEIEFTIPPILELPDYKVKVKCYVQAFPQDQSFAIIPFAGEIIQAEAEILAEVERLISVSISVTKATVAVYRGSAEV